ncbi:MAG: universal stress protein [Gammaproteobacteria bacterium]|nr:universal stress protein [Gammaproteobacteria bacterium]
MKILVCVDGSDYASAGVELLRNFPFPESTEVTVLYVIEQEAPFATEESIVNEREREVLRELRTSLQERAEEVVQHEAERLLSTGWAVRESTRTGELPEAILSAADEIDADLIVIGARGFGERRYSGMGRVCKKVIKYAHRSVLVSRPKEILEDKRLRLLLAFDGSPAAKSAVKMLAGLPLAERVEITVLSVVTVATTLYSKDILERLSETWKEYVRCSQKELDAAGVELEKATTNVSTRLIDGGANATDDIVEAANIIDAHLVVVGRTGKTRFKQFLLGSVSSEALEYSPCSVLVMIE